jgi:hypothetical protein
MRRFGGSSKLLPALGFVASLGCLQITVAGASTGGQSTGILGQTAGVGASTGGHSTTSGGSTTGPSCAGVSCAAFYACDPSDGLCKCGGQVCVSGNCSESGTCLAACDANAGTFSIPGSDGPGSALFAPPAYVNEYYSYQLPLACTSPPNVYWAVVSSDGGACDSTSCREMFSPPGLTVYSNGEIQDVASELGTFEFMVEASGTLSLDDGGLALFTAFQNVVLTVEQDAGQ